MKPRPKPSGTPETLAVKVLAVLLGELAWLLILWAYYEARDPIASAAWRVWWRMRKLLRVRRRPVVRERSRGPVNYYTDGPP